MVFKSKEERREIIQSATEKVKGYITKPQTQRIPITPRKKVQRSPTTAIAGKLIHVLAPKGSMVKAITTPKKKGRGRGRPTGTFKTRVLPSGRVVKVHTSVYKKLLAQEKAQMRLVRVQKQFEAERVAMEQDPRFQPADDSFLTEPDQVHEMNVERARQEAEMAQFEQQRAPPQQKQPGVVRRAIGGISRLGGAGRPQQQVVGYDEYGRPVIQQVQPQMAQRPQVQDMGPSKPGLSVFGGKSSILNTPNIFNNPGQSNVAKRRYPQ